MSPASKVADRMILPAAEVASGEVSGHRLMFDDRIPIRVSHDRPARLLGYWDRPGQCPDARHLWDAIVATAPEVVPDRQDDYEDDERLRFRLALTCVRCGRIERLEGVTDQDGHYGSPRVDPQPLRVGSLLAQQVGGDGYGGDLASWVVRDRPGRAPIGCITWGEAFGAGTSSRAGSTRGPVVRWWRPPRRWAACASWPRPNGPAPVVMLHERPSRSRRRSR